MCNKDLGDWMYPTGGVDIMTDGFSLDFEFHLCFDCWNKVKKFVETGE